MTRQDGVFFRSYIRTGAIRPIPTDSDYIIVRSVAALSFTYFHNQRHHIVVVVTIFIHTVRFICQNNLCHHCVLIWPFVQGCHQCRWTVVSISLGNRDHVSVALCFIIEIFGSIVEYIQVSHSDDDHFLRVVRFNLVGIHKGHQMTCPQ